MKSIILALALVSLVSCAARPSSIQPAAVSKIPYVNISCSNLEMQMTQELSKLESLTGEQLSARNWDIALTILFIAPGLGALTGDSEDEIAQSKGRMIVMADEYSTRCSVQE